MIIDGDITVLLTNYEENFKMVATVKKSEYKYIKEKFNFVPIANNVAIPVNVIKLKKDEEQNRHFL